MIITGYQGIGKSTLARKENNIIDLESASFWNYENGNKTRPDDWYVYYCQVAEHLSKQGYIVFVSCHQQVRDWLFKNGKEKFCAIYPSITIKNDWLKRLENRYNTTKSEKDLRALEHAQNYFDSDIQKLNYENSYNIELYSNSVKIWDINYDLKKLVDLL